MDKYLQLLLQQENTVIIPDLGALMITNEGTQELMFNEYLKFNDGKLHKFISENSNMDEQEAANFVAKYVREIKIELDKGETYDMFEFGRFKKKDDKIEFDNWNKFNGTAATPIVEAPKKSTQLDEASDKVEAKDPVKKAPTKKEAPKEDKKVEKPVAKKETKVKAEKKSTKKAEEKKEEVKNTYVPPVTPPKVEEKVDEVKTKVEEVAPKKEEIKKPVIATASAVASSPGKDVKDAVKTSNTKKEVKPNAKAKPQKEEKKKRGAGLWILLVLLLLLGAGGIYYGMNYKALNEKFGFTKAEEPVVADNSQTEDENTDTEDADINSEDEMMSDSLDMEYDENGNPILTENETDGEEANEMIEESVETPVEEPVQEEAPAPVNYGNTSGSYHVIVGGFADQSNANNLAADLKGKGYGATVVGQFDNLHMVAAQSFNSREEAQQAMSGIRSGVTESAWIFKYPK